MKAGKRFLWGVLLTIAASGAAAEVFDCAGARCPAIEIAGDPAATLPNGKASPFSGHADPTIRKEPDGTRLWMAYSWPHIRVEREADQRRMRRGAETAPGVDIHLATSDDGGRRWRFAGNLWSSVEAVAPDGGRGHMGHEVANLLPVRMAGGVAWYGARLQYFLPDAGGFRKRPVDSFRILVGRADSPAGLAAAPAARLGSMKTDARWGMDVNLAALDPRTRHCHLWNEPALYHDGEELFLALSCMAFRGKAPDMEKNDLVVFATRAQGDPARWQWRFAGVLADARDARELGGERLTQVDLAEGRDGRLLAIVTPDTWDRRAGDFVHHGCRVVEVDTANGALRLARDARDRLKLRTDIRASDAGEAGTAACSYDPAAATGVVMTKRDKESGGLSQAKSLTASLHRTGLHP